MVNIVVPGELVSEKPIKMPYAFVENGKHTRQSYHCLTTAAG